MPSRRPSCPAVSSSGGHRPRPGPAPRLILADEPTGNLDTHTADDIFALLREFNRQSNCACLIVTHDPRLAARCDRIVRLVDGRIADDLPTAAETNP
jgi:ABC-type lipoprotein export system ATPase subunit